jgi:phosphate transport system substrate-binding protein
MVSRAGNILNGNHMRYHYIEKNGDAMLSRSVTFLGSLAISICLSVASAQTTPPGGQTVPPVDTKLPRYAKPAGHLKGQLLIGGSGTTKRFVEPLVLAFIKLHPDVLQELTLRGSATAPTGLGDHEYNVGVMSREMTLEEKAGVKKETAHDVVEVAIARDAILVLVNKDNPVEGITLPQLDALYGANRLAGYGKPIAIWGDLGVKGALATVKISPYGILEEHNGTVETFRRIVLRGGPLNRSVGNIAFPDKEYGQAVSAVPGGISYNIEHPPVEGARAIGLASKEGDPFVLADPKTVSTGEYPLSRYIYVYHCDSTDRAVVEFFRFAVSYDGQEIIAAHSASPLSAKTAEEQLKKLAK